MRTAPGSAGDQAHSNEANIADGICARFLQCQIVHFPCSLDSSHFEEPATAFGVAVDRERAAVDGRTIPCQRFHEGAARLFEYARCRIHPARAWIERACSLTRECRIVEAR